MDRYTILRWKEGWADFISNFPGSICNGMTAARLAKVGLVFIAALLVIGLFYLRRPNPPTPMSKRLVLTETDAQGDRWAMDYLKNQDIEAILNGPVKPGQPLTLTVKFTQKNPNLLIDLEIIGVAGERYFPGIIKNGQWQKPPKFSLTDRNNKLLHQGQFAYG